MELSRDMADRFRKVGYSLIADAIWGFVYSSRDTLSMWIEKGSLLSLYPEIGSIVDTLKTGPNDLGMEVCFLRLGQPETSQFLYDVLEGVEKNSEPHSKIAHVIETFLKGFNEARIISRAIQD